MAIHSVNNSLVYGVIVIKAYKSKGSLFATASVNHDFNHFNFPILFKIISQVMFFMSSLMPPIKIFFTVKWAQVFGNLLLRQASLVPQLFRPPCEALHSWLCSPPPPGMCDKPKASGLLGVWIPHYHAVCECSPLLKMARLFQSSILR